MSATPYELSEALVRTGGAWAQLVERFLQARFGLSYAQFLVLDTIARSPGLKQGELARRLGRTKGDMTGVVGRLERAGLVRRDPVPGDRRALSLYVTERGRLVTLVLPELRALAQAALGGLSPEERALVARSLARLEASLTQTLALGTRPAPAPARGAEPGAEAGPASPGPPVLYDPRKPVAVRVVPRRVRRRLRRPGRPPGEEP